MATTGALATSSTDVLIFCSNQPGDPTPNLPPGLGEVPWAPTSITVNRQTMMRMRITRSQETLPRRRAATITPPSTTTTASDHAPVSTTARPPIAVMRSTVRDTASPMQNADACSVRKPDSCQPTVPVPSVWEMGMVPAFLAISNGFTDIGFFSCSSVLVPHRFNGR